MKWWEDRVANGLAKAGGGLKTQEHIECVLAQDVAVYADLNRATQKDLWPAIWALAATLSRQFNGNIFIVAGLDRPLAAPGPLSSRCIFTSDPPPCRLTVGLGIGLNHSPSLTCWGDVRRDQISIRQPLEGQDKATPWAAFAIAGYLSYAMLATTAGFLPHKERFSQPAINLGMPPPQLCIDTAAHSIALLGLGHLGNAYLALLYFIAQQYGGFPQILLLDRSEGGGRLERVNWKTHILLEETSAWEGELKTERFADHMEALGARVSIDTTTLEWTWRKPATHPPIALLGFDSFDARRMAIEAGYEWLVDAGIGSQFDRPRVTWHSLPPDKEIGKRFFNDTLVRQALQIPMSSPLVNNLENHSDPCGWVTSFHGISAAAPSMGVVAASYAWLEVLKAWMGSRRPLSGNAYLWSPGIPPSTASL